MKASALGIVFLCFFAFQAMASANVPSCSNALENHSLKSIKRNHFLVHMTDSVELVQTDALKKKFRKKKVVAVALAVTLGVFGVHRLYLGCSTKVPVIYTITLGGGFGFLMVSDIIAIIATKDISQYSPNGQIFMWAK